MSNRSVYANAEDSDFLILETSDGITGPPQIEVNAVGGSIIYGYIGPAPVPKRARDLRECVICGEAVTVSNATVEWENRHSHGAGPIIESRTA